MSRVRSNRVCFTINNYTQTILDNFEAFAEQFKEGSTYENGYFIVGIEEAPNTGTPHLQGYIRIPGDPKKCGIKFWKSTLPGGEQAHFENARGNEDSNKAYCSKDGIYLEAGQFGAETNKWKEIYETAKQNLEEAVALDYEFGLRNYNQLKSIHDGHQMTMTATLEELRDWQKIAISKLLNQGNREILFVVDTEGGKGKSALAKHMITTLNCWACQGKSTFRPSFILRGISPEPPYFKFITTSPAVGDPCTHPCGSASVSSQSDGRQLANFIII